MSKVVSSSDAHKLVDIFFSVGAARELQTALALLFKGGEAAAVTTASELQGQ